LNLHWYFTLTREEALDESSWDSVPVRHIRQMPGDPEGRKKLMPD